MVLVMAMDAYRVCITTLVEYRVSYTVDVIRTTPPLPGSTGCVLPLDVTAGGAALVGLALVDGLGEDTGGGADTPPAQTPKAGLHSAPQWSGVPPHQPCPEQQSPHLDPLQVIPPPHVPSVLTNSSPGFMSCWLLPPADSGASWSMQ